LEHAKALVGGHGCQFIFQVIGNSVSRGISLHPVDHVLQVGVVVLHATGVCVCIVYSLLSALNLHFQAGQCPLTCFILALLFGLDA
jgi:hypothetical protein